MKERLLFLICFLCISFMLKAADKPVIKISTENVDLIYRVGNNGRLYQSYLGKRLNHATDIAHLPQGSEAYLTHGMEDYFEPAIHIVHNDGNPSTLLKYVSHTRNQVSPGVDEVVITMQDDKYPVTVKLHYVAYQKENLIKTFTEISHREKKPVQLHKYASSMLHLNRANYFLTEFSGDWASEAHVKEQPLEFGKKTIDTKLGARANMFCSPFFQLALDGKSEENQGEVLVGTLGWTGNFSFVFEVDNKNELRVISGINPYASEYSLKPNEIFRTPDFYFTYSFTGKGHYSEIMYLYRQGVRYWFNDMEIRELHLANAGFEVQTVEFEMLTQYFEKPTEEEEPLFFMTTAQILARLRDICAMQLSEKRLGEALRKAGFKRVQKRINKQTYSVYGYRIKPVPTSCTNSDYG